MREAEVQWGFDTFVSTYLEDLLRFHGDAFQTYNTSLQQQIHHLLFVTNQVCSSGLVQTVLEEHNTVKVSNISSFKIINYIITS